MIGRKFESGSDVFVTRTHEALNCIGSLFEGALNAQVMDDEERSSNDFQDPDSEIPDKLILRPLNTSQQGRLVDLGDGSLLDCEDGGDSEDMFDESSGSEEDLPAPSFCRNCTNELEPYQQICSVRCKFIMGQNGDAWHHVPICLTSQGKAMDCPNQTLSKIDYQALC